MIYNGKSVGIMVGMNENELTVTGLCWIISLVFAVITAIALLTIALCTASESLWLCVPFHHGFIVGSSVVVFFFLVGVLFKHIGQ